MARPRLKFKLTADHVTLLAADGVPANAIASANGIAHTTFERHYGAAWQKGHGQWLIELARQQARVARSGNPTMLIWLGKQFLGQSDKQEQSGQIAFVLKDETIDKLG
jgi:hypothetical protein